MVEGGGDEEVGEGCSRSKGEEGCLQITVMGRGGGVVVAGGDDGIS